MVIVIIIFEYFLNNLIKIVYGDGNYKYVLVVVVHVSGYSPCVSVHTSFECDTHASMEFIIVI